LEWLEAHKVLKDNSDQVKQGRVDWIGSHQQGVPKQVVQPRAHQQAGDGAGLVLELLGYLWIVLEHVLIDLLLSGHLWDFVEDCSGVLEISVQLKVEFEHYSEGYRHEEQLALQTFEDTLGQLDTQRRHLLHTVKQLMLLYICHVFTDLREVHFV